jgi:hypothetical protein
MLIGEGINAAMSECTLQDFLFNEINFNTEVFLKNISISAILKILYDPLYSF